MPIGGRSPGTTKKWRNLRADPHVAPDVDDLVSTSLRRVRGVDVRGEADPATGTHGPGTFVSDEVIRIHPRRITSWAWTGPQPPEQAEHGPGVMSPTPGQP
ncbi:hypothetical protein [Streptomyces meridianus]|uniref:Pyridoxamine 5'-phosphate oxidase putative domain-containing protein n=1 Tax=Streptomyces meridianus TaxID=2938945 RepID=A0ABT0X2X3_9ACTN|nr:hypothetical protein [Streptomyces meridianus]MCM2576891.1 hypothetical protein [Streptomyces meridianus]